MDFLVNDLSLYGQYPDAPTFQDAIGRLMKMKETARRFGRDIFCHRKIAVAQVTSSLSMPQIIRHFDRNKRQSIMQWLTRTGPFWEDDMMHSPEDYLVCRDEIVTDSAVGEAAWCCLNGNDRKLVSFSPSKWEISPIFVDFVGDDASNKGVAVDNFWELSTFEKALEKIPAPLDSWAQLQAIAILRFPQLFFSDDAFKPLEGHPFVSGSAQRLMVIFSMLNHFKSCHEKQGKRTTEGHEIYKDFFTGKKGGGGRGSLFSDSSDKEKQEFKNNLTFKHPERPNESLFCTWHGKVQTPQLRVHFSWPVKADEPLYVVYVGPKITKL